MSDGSNQLKKIKKIVTNTNLNFLIGAGCSFNKVENKISYPLMNDLLNYVKEDEDVKEIYDSLKKQIKIHYDQYDIVKSVFDNYLYAEKANVENFLSVIEGIDLYIFDNDFKEEVQKIQNILKEVILKRIKSSDDSTVLSIYKTFYDGIRKIKEISNESKHNINVFTTNYDMLNENAMEDLNIHYYAGFYGIANRKFNLSYYNYEFIDNFNIGKGQVIVNCDHINLYKLHGSISWYYKDCDLYEKSPNEVDFLPEIIYPSIAKFKNTNLLIHYSALMREFSNKICRKDTTLIVSGTSLGDEHINKIIENALTINSFTLIIFMVGIEESIKKMQERFRNNHNVMVFDESTTFNELTNILNQINGELHE